jgi:hypothetical protein
MPSLDRLTRDEVIDTYDRIQKQTGQPFSIKTLPYYSTTLVEFEVVNVDTTHSFGYAIARAQTAEWFNYGIGGRLVYAGNDAHKATRADTNLSRASSTNGAFDFVIEALGIHAKPPRVQFASSAGHYYSGQTPDPDLVKALAADADIYDPTAIALSQQASSPFFSSSVLYSALKNTASIGITFDSQNYRELGLLGNFAQGREAHPEDNGNTPPDDLALQIAEGLLWAKDGEPDSDLTMRLVLHNPVIVPISGIVAPGDGSTVKVPTMLWLPLTATLHGLEIGLPSSNT